MTCTHYWTVTSECPMCLRAEIERLQARWNEAERETARARAAKVRADLDCTAALNKVRAEVDTAYRQMNEAIDTAREAQAEVEALRAAIKTHNDERVATCDWRRKNETHPGSDGKPLSNCESYTGRGRLCPDCPRHDMIDAAREGK